MVILSPAIEKRCSILLKRTGVKITYINDQKSILEARNEKAPAGTEPHKGLFRSDKYILNQCSNLVKRHLKC